MRKLWNKMDDFLGKLAIAILIFAILFVLDRIGVFDAWQGQFEMYRDYHRSKTH